MGPKQIAKAYFFSAWLPSVLALMISCLLFFGEIVLGRPLVSLLLLLALAVSLLGILASGIVQLIKRRWVSGSINLFSLLLMGFLMSKGLAMLLFAALFNDGPDNFGKDIVIPGDMQLSDPVEKFTESGEAVRDELTEKIIAAFSAKSLEVGHPTVPTDVAVLNEFNTANRQKLIQHLSASPRWFVTEERGKP